jgi:hypothetical protein
MADYKISVDLDNLTLGDLESLESRNFSQILQVLEHVVRLDGVEDEDQPQALRALPWTSLNEITEAIRDAVEAEVSPEVGGKN